MKVRPSMKRFLFAALLAGSAQTAQADDVDVGISVSIGQPGFYGRIDIGDFPRPRLIHASPVVILPVPGALPPPVYLHVPPGHAKDWSKHCGKYDACGHPAYFVQESWYKNEYAPRYREKHGKRDKRDKHSEGGREKGKHKDKD